METQRKRRCSLQAQADGWEWWGKKRSPFLTYSLISPRFSEQLKAVIFTSWKSPNSVCMSVPISHLIWESFQVWYFFSSRMWLCGQTGLHAPLRNTHRVLLACVFALPWIEQRRT